MHTPVSLSHEHHKLKFSLGLIECFLRVHVGLRNFTEVKSFIPSLNLSRRE